jgi:hypothetical protein
MRRTQPLHPSAFLIDHNKEWTAPDCFPDSGNQSGNLRRRGDVATKQDYARRPRSSQKADFVGR